MRVAVCFSETKQYIEFIFQTVKNGNKKIQLKSLDHRPDRSNYKRFQKSFWESLYPVGSRARLWIK